MERYLIYFIDGMDRIGKESSEDYILATKIFAYYQNLNDGKTYHLIDTKTETVLF